MMRVAPTGTAPDSETTELNRVADEHQPAGRDDRAVDQRDQVQGSRSIAAVTLLTGGNTLFNAEDLVAELERLVELGLCPQPPDFEPESGVGGGGFHTEQLAIRLVRFRHFAGRIRSPITICPRVCLNAHYVSGLTAFACHCPEKPSSSSH
jgi:hypothetical protein